MIVRPAQATDVTPLAAVLARAFYDDPPFAWMLPNPGGQAVSAAAHPCRPGGQRHGSSQSRRAACLARLARAHVESTFDYDRDGRTELASLDT